MAVAESFKTNRKEEKKEITALFGESTFYNGAYHEENKVEDEKNAQGWDMNNQKLWGKSLKIGNKYSATCLSGDEQIN